MHHEFLCQERKTSVVEKQLLVPPSWQCTSSCIATDSWLFGQHEHNCVPGQFLEVATVLEQCINARGESDGKIYSPQARRQVGFSVPAYISQNTQLLS
jgi:hypothetical protein